MIKNKKILVVGAGGFIGGHLVKKLLMKIVQNLHQQKMKIMVQENWIA